MNVEIDYSDETLETLQQELVDDQKQLTRLESELKQHPTRGASRDSIEQTVMEFRKRVEQKRARITSLRINAGLNRIAS